MPSPQFHTPQYLVSQPRASVVRAKGRRRVVGRKVAEQKRVSHKTQRAGRACSHLRTLTAIAFAMAGSKGRGPTQSTSRTAGCGGRRRPAETGSPRCGGRRRRHARTSLALPDSSGGPVSFCSEPWPGYRPLPLPPPSVARSPCSLLHLPPACLPACLPALTLTPPSPPVSIPALSGSSLGHAPGRAPTPGPGRLE